MSNLSLLVISIFITVTMKLKFLQLVSWSPVTCYKYYFCNFTAAYDGLYPFHTICAAAGRFMSVFIDINWITKTPWPVYGELRSSNTFVAEVTQISQNFKYTRLIKCPSIFTSKWQASWHKRCFSNCWPFSDGRKS